jgi:hypothetical protein
MYNTSHINSRIPIAVQICKESRSVALLAGFKEIYDGNFVDSDAPGWKAMNSIKDLWITPSIDVLWKQRLVAKCVTHNWLKAEANNNCGDIQDPEGIYRALREDEWKIVLQGDSGPFSDYMRPRRGWAFANVGTDVPNTEHPWVAKVLRDMPCFEPVVMFRLCADKCYAPKPPTPQRIIGGRGTGRQRHCSV